jgi:hypothetical protein
MLTNRKKRGRRSNQLELPPLTEDAIPLLLKGRWLVNIHHTLYASFVADAVVVSPAGLPSAVMMRESALMLLEDFVEAYPEQRWVELPGHE